MITPGKPTRITGYAGETSAWRITLQREDREGRSLSYVPEVATTQGAAPDFAIAHLFRGFRPRLELTWSVGTGSTLELWDGSAWGDPSEIQTASALLSILGACEAGDLWAEPYSEALGAFWARCWAEPQEIRDIKGVVHSGLKLTLDGAGADRVGGLLAQIPHAPTPAPTPAPSIAVVGSLPYVVRVPQCALLADGRVLVAGGQNAGYYGTAATAQCAIYDPAINTAVATGSLMTARSDHRLVALPNGTILAVGGGDNLNPILTTEIYSPSTGTWSAGPTLPRKCYDAAVIGLSDGTVIVFGGGHADILALSMGGSAWSVVGSFAGHTLDPQVSGESAIQPVWATLTDGTIVVRSFRDDRVSVPANPSGAPFAEVCLGGIYALDITRTAGVVTAVTPRQWAESSQWHQVQPVTGYPYLAAQVYGDWISPSSQDSNLGATRAQRLGDIILIPREDGSVVAAGGYCGNKLLADRCLRFDHQSYSVPYSYGKYTGVLESFLGRITVDSVIPDPVGIRRDGSVTVWSSDGKRIYNGLGKRIAGDGAVVADLYGPLGTLTLSVPRASPGVVSLGAGRWLLVGGYNAAGNLSSVESVRVW